VSDRHPRMCFAGPALRRPRFEKARVCRPELESRLSWHLDQLHHAISKLQSSFPLMFTRHNIVVRLFYHETKIALQRGTQYQQRGKQAGYFSL